VTLNHLLWGKANHALRKTGKGLIKIGRELGIGTGTVQRVVGATWPRRAKCAAILRRRAAMLTTDPNLFTARRMALYGAIIALIFGLFREWPVFGLAELFALIVYVMLGAIIGYVGSAGTFWPRAK
jgi:hypothetical protein